MYTHFFWHFIFNYFIFFKNKIIENLYKVYLKLVVSNHFLGLRSQVYPISGQ